MSTAKVLLVLAGAGLGGDLTTYSAFGYETARLLEAGDWRHGALNVVTSLAAGLGVAFAAGAAVAAL